ncbi:hypothetical protein Q8F55_000068 [Vanrija albida]|uniref:F-box domain-containing protein n=1 Tax=Vanrija albida TaxID=181172 RepID=A0ABR3QC77_9TREE
MAPGAIDHTAHPHIVDDILAACDTRTAIAFRGTSRAFRDRVDHALLTHVVPYIVPGPGSSFSGGPHPGPTVRFVRPSDCLGIGLATPPLLPNVPEAIRALDLRLSVAHLAFYNRCTGVRTLRRANYSVWLHVPTTFDLLSTVVDSAVLEGAGNRGFSVPPGLGTYVLHLHWPESEYVVGSTSIAVEKAEGRSGWPREMVLVLRPESRGEPPRALHGLYFIRELTVGMLCVLEGGGSVTIVGVEKVSRLNMGAGEGEDLIERFKAMVMLFWRSLSDPPDELEVDDLLARVEFVAVDEWHAALKAKGRDGDGLDVYDLQAMWPVQC